MLLKVQSLLPRAAVRTDGGSGRRGRMVLTGVWRPLFLISFPFVALSTLQESGPGQVFFIQLLADVDFTEVPPSVCVLKTQREPKRPVPCLGGPAFRGEEARNTYANR